jgi:hypothetical protein
MKDLGVDVQVIRDMWCVIYHQDGGAQKVKMVFMTQEKKKISLLKQPRARHQHHVGTFGQK